MTNAQHRYATYFLHYPQHLEKNQETHFSAEFAHMQRAYLWSLQGETGEIPRFWNDIKDQLMNYGYWQIFIEWGETIYKILKQQDLAEDEAWLLSDLGWLAMEQTHYAKANDLFEKSLKGFHYLQDIWGICILERYLGVLAFRQQLLDKAEKHFQKASTIANKNQFSTVLPEIENLLGSLTRKRGDFAQAYRHYFRAKVAYENSDNKWSLTIVLRNMAWMEIQRSQFTVAQIKFEEAIHLCRKIGRKDVLYGCLLGLAEAHYAHGNIPLAKSLASEARQGFTQLGMLRGLERTQKLFARLYINHVQ